MPHSPTVSRFVPFRETTKGCQKKNGQTTAIWCFVVSYVYTYETRNGGLQDHEKLEKKSA